LVVARDLLGMLLIREEGERRMVGRIVECEAYTDRNDPASHSRGGQTPANSMMYAPGGYLYVYFTYGMHFCANVVTEREGKGCAVLLRALEPVEGLDLMAHRRGVAVQREKDLCSGPAKLCQAFGISREENGTDLCRGTIWIARGTPRLRGRGLRTPRIGIREGREKLWRFVLPDSPWSSR
jgi:DNA-3-methyladenine glycosylase